MDHLNRRDWMRAAARGAAAVAVPFIQGCAGIKDLLRAGKSSGTKDYFTRFGVDRSLLDKTLHKALSRGGDYCDVYLEHRIKHSLSMEDGEISRASSSVDLGAGVRVLKGESTGYAFCEELDRPPLMRAADTAGAIADAAPGAEVKPLAAVPVKSRYAVEVPWEEVLIDKKLPLVERAEAKARSIDSRISKVSVYLSDETCRVLVADSHGRLVEDDRPMTLMVVRCTARHKGVTETGRSSRSARHGISYYSPGLVDEVAREAARNTVRLFEATPPPAGAYPVVLAPGRSGILLHEAIGHGMEADYNRKGMSIYSTRMGKRVAPEVVNIVDDGTLARMRGSLNVDDEGIKTECTRLVENGILRSYLQDKLSAGYYGARLTGSGRRESFRHYPLPRMRNTYMLSGPHSAEEIISSLKKGLYAESFLNGQVNIGVGDFSFYLKYGRMIENGRLARPVKDSNLIGNGPEVLETIDMVGDDLDFHRGSGTCGKQGQGVPVSFGIPTVRAKAISIGGRST